MKPDKVNGNPQYKVCIVGVGFVGLTLGIALTTKGVSVRGIEKNAQLVKDLNDGRTEIVEPGLDEALSSAVIEGLFKAYPVGGHETDLLDCNVFIITVGTPIRDRLIDLDPLGAAVDEIVPYLKEGDLVIIRSTVAIGATRDRVLPKLVKTGLAIDLAMCPERTVEGIALEEIESLPQIIGCLNEASSISACKFFSVICKENVLVSSLEAAEVTKLVNNTYRDVMFGFANEVARISSTFNLNAREIIDSANRNYPRSNIALPGPSGGPCLEKDPWILIQSANNRGISLDIAKSARLMNEVVISEFLNKALKGRRRFSNVGVLGLAFKGEPPTRDTRGSAVFDVIDFLGREFPEVTLFGFEPAGRVDAFEGTLEQLLSVESVVETSDVIIVLTNASSFEGVDKIICASGKSHILVIDFWDKISKNNLQSGQELFAWGG
jgi:UDP-N-acetyl-D-mannosaminuronic acid dehydrogenase